MQIEYYNVQISVHYFAPSKHPSPFIARLMARALSTLAIMWSGISPIYCFNLCLSIVLICSSRIIESLSSLSKSFTSVCVGSFAFVCVRLVIGATIIVGLCLFPVLLEIVRTGLVPPYSEPMTGLSVA